MLGSRLPHYNIKSRQKLVVSRQKLVVSGQSDGEGKQGSGWKAIDWQSAKQRQGRQGRQKLGGVQGLGGMTKLEI